jgi:hypothetical protein
MAVMINAARVAVEACACTADETSPKPRVAT